MSSLEEDAIKQAQENASSENQSVVVDIANPENRELLESLDEMVAHHLLMLSAIKSVPSYKSKGWETLLQHGSYALSFNLQAHKTNILLYMDASGEVDIQIKRDGKLLHHIDVKAESD